MGEAIKAESAFEEYDDVSFVVVQVVVEDLAVESEVVENDVGDGDHVVEDFGR